MRIRIGEKNNSAIKTLPDSKKGTRHFTISVVPEKDVWISC